MKVYIVMSHYDGITGLHGAFVHKSEAEKMKEYMSQARPEETMWIEPLTVIDFPEES